jgi:DNA repair protein RadC
LNSHLDEVRERAERYGTEVISDADLLALVLGCGGPRVQEATKDGTHGLLRGRGLTPVQRSRLNAAIELGKRVILAERPMPKTIRTPADVAPFLHALLNKCEEERFYVVLLNARNAVIDSPVLVAAGTVDACAIHPRDVFRPAMAANASAIILVHNHPSGNPHASPEDLGLTNRIKVAGDMVGITLLDHLIVAGAGVASIRKSQEVW